MAEVIECDNCGKGQHMSMATYFEVIAHTWAPTLGGRGNTPAHLCSSECLAEYAGAGMVSRLHRTAEV